MYVPTCWRPDVEKQAAGAPLQMHGSGLRSVLPSQLPVTASILRHSLACTTAPVSASVLTPPSVCNLSLPPSWPGHLPLFRAHLNNSRWYHQILNLITPVKTLFLSKVVFTSARPGLRHELTFRGAKFGLNLFFFLQFLRVEAEVIDLESSFLLQAFSVVSLPHYCVSSIPELLTWLHLHSVQNESYKVVVLLLQSCTKLSTFPISSVPHE